MTEYIVNADEENSLMYGRKYEELIRCKECKWHFDGTYYGGDHMCSELDRIVNENSFCAWAERKEK